MRRPSFMVRLEAKSYSGEKEGDAGIMEEIISLVSTAHMQRLPVTNLQMTLEVLPLGTFEMPNFTASGNFFWNRNAQYSINGFVISNLRPDRNSARI